MKRYGNDQGYAPQPEQQHRELRFLLLPALRSRRQSPAMEVAAQLMQVQGLDAALRSPSCSGDSRFLRKAVAGRPSWFFIFAFYK